jgi:8-oxo-dGTP diphosphatase
MNDWSSAPTFGEPDATLPRRVRPSAYALILNPAGQLALAQTPNGFYLPGGGANPGESAAAAVQREVREELGLHVAVGSWYRLAIEHAPVPREGASFEKRSTFYDATVVGPSGVAPEPDHEAVWIAPADALAILRPKSHSWVVAQWLADHGELS